jgi:hypothetical protein
LDDFDFVLLPLVEVAPNPFLAWTESEEERAGADRLQGASATGAPRREESMA